MDSFKRIIAYVAQLAVILLLAGQLILALVFVGVSDKITSLVYPPKPEISVEILVRHATDVVTELRQAEVLVRTRWAVPPTTGNPTPRPLSEQEWATLLPVLDHAAVLLGRQDPPFEVAQASSNGRALLLARLAVADPKLRDGFLREEGASLLGELVVARAFGLSLLDQAARESDTPAAPRESVAPRLTTVESYRLAPKFEALQAFVLPSEREALREEEKARARLFTRLIGAADFELLVVCACLGAFGAGLQGIWSMVCYLGERKFLPSWTFFYLARPAVGGGLALVFCFLVKGGFAQLNNESLEAGSFFAFGALALLVGPFLSQAMEKLKHIAEAMLSSAVAKDSLRVSKPVIRTVVITPNTPAVGMWTLTVAGDELNSALTAYLNQRFYPVTPGAGGTVLVEVPMATFPAATDADLVLTVAQPSLVTTERFTVRFP